MSSQLGSTVCGATGPCSPSRGVSGVQWRSSSAVLSSPSRLANSPKTLLPHRTVASQAVVERHSGLPGVGVSTIAPPAPPQHQGLSTKAPTSTPPQQQRKILSMPKGVVPLPPLPTQLKPEEVAKKKEVKRQEFRTVYDHTNWVKHRNTLRYVSKLANINQSNVMSNIGPAVTWVVGVSTALTLYMTCKDSGVLPAQFPSLVPSAACQAFISSTSFALSMLLVFRTNATYGRWDEARKMWGGLLNRSRDIMRQSITCLPDDAVESKKAVARWTIAFARSLRVHFQPEAQLDNELSDVLTPAEMKMLLSAQHRPVRAMHVISQIVQSAHSTSPVHQMQISQNLTFFQDVLGGCERLLRAPIPVSWVRHTARFLTAWLTLLPFALYGTCGWGVIPTCGAIAAVLCGIEEIGVQCEEPFGILPLDAICKRIEADVIATLKDEQDTRAVLSQIWQADAAAGAAKDAAATATQAAMIDRAGRVYRDEQEEAALDAELAAWEAMVMTAAAAEAAERGLPVPAGTVVQQVRVSELPPAGATPAQIEQQGQEQHQKHHQQSEAGAMVPAVPMEVAAESHSHTIPMAQHFVGMSSNIVPIPASLSTTNSASSPLSPHSRYEGADVVLIDYDMDHHTAASTSSGSPSAAAYGSYDDMFGLYPGPGQYALDHTHPDGDFVIVTYDDSDVVMVTYEDPYDSPYEDPMAEALREDGQVEAALRARYKSGGEGGSVSSGTVTGAAARRVQTKELMVVLRPNF